MKAQPVSTGGETCLCFWIFSFHPSWSWRRWTLYSPLLPTANAEKSLLLVLRVCICAGFVCDKKQVTL